MARSWLFTALLASHFCSAQVTGTFSLEKPAFAQREPVFLSFTLHNDGQTKEEVVTADPYSFCSGYELHITRDGVPGPTDFQSFGGSCLSGAISLEPGASHTERILLNYRDDSSGVLCSCQRPGRLHRRRFPRDCFRATRQGLPHLHRTRSRSNASCVSPPCR